MLKVCKKFVQNNKMCKFGVQDDDIRSEDDKILEKFFQSDLLSDVNNFHHQF